MKKTASLLLIALTQVVYSQNVDLFTGAYSQGFPLMTVPSNRGAAIELNAIYNAGIRVKQSASDIGLGWSLSGAGEITRQVAGYPDDTWQFISYMPKDLNNIFTMSAQGALYPDNKFPKAPYPYSSGAGSTNFDIGFADINMDTAQFAFPDYDNFNISSPGLHGNMGLKYFKAYEWEMESYTQPLTLPSGQAPYLPPYNFKPVSGTARKPQFYFKNSFYDTLISRHFPTPGCRSYIAPHTSAMDPTSTFTDAAYPGGSNEPYIGRPLNSTASRDENYDRLTGRLGTENFIEYFTNGEIETAAGVFTGTLSGFLDYTPNHSRSGGGFPSEGIGYFRVTNTQGFTYHYALPVYQRQNTAYTLPLKNDYTLDGSLINPSTFTATNNPLTLAGNNQVIIRSSDANTYALKWLLTAITGPDYEDNGNNYPDDADKGYWVRYDYVNWTNQLFQRSPQFGMEYSFRPDATTEDMPNYMPPVPYNASSGQPYKLSGNWGNINTSMIDVYYLNKIRTSSHTAVFVRDVRKDERGGDIGKTPLLYLKRIILFKNDDFTSLINTYSTSSFPEQSYSAFDFDETKNNEGRIFNESWYQGHSAWDDYVLNQVEFDQDYSLSKKYHGNIEASCPSDNGLKDQTFINTNLVVGNPATSGKLTLNRILTYDYKNRKLAPSTKFTYALNPDYSSTKEDYWGFYKSDATPRGTSRYTSPVSQLSTNAWSLYQIEDPLGGKQEIVYESNTYNRVIDDESSSGVRGASFIYRIKEAAKINEQFNITMEDGASSAEQLNEFVTLCTSSIPGLKKNVCLPAIDNGVEPYYNCGTAGCTYNNKLFVNGASNITLNTSGGTSNSLTGTITTSPFCATLVQGNKRYGPITTPLLDPTTLLWRTHTSSANQQGITYTGNGFLMFETPVGYNVYGNGIRVASIKTINESGEEYVKKYDYQDGVAMNEMDRFEYPRARRGMNDPDTIYHSPKKYTQLQCKKAGMFVNSYVVGYSKVTEKDMGRITTDNGKKETYFLTDPLYKNKLFFGNTLVSTIDTTLSSYVSGGLYDYISSVNVLNECIRRFDNAFGAVTEQRVYDKNNLMLSKTVNDYDRTDQGAIVEVFRFKNPFWYAFRPELFTSLFNLPYQVFPDNSYAKGGCMENTTNILREYTTKLKSTTTYFMNSEAKQEILKIDELTGQALCVRNTDQNGNTSLSYSSPAYKRYNDSLTSTSPGLRKVIALRESYFSYTSIDSTLTGGTTFAAATHNSYSKQTKQRIFSGNNYSSPTYFLPYYLNLGSWIVDPGPGSLNAYGLFDKSVLAAPPLRHISSITLIDTNRHILEGADHLSRYNATKYAYKGDHKSATVTNCNYESFTYAGFEAPAGPTGSGAFEGELVVNSSHAISNSVAHTGIGSLVITNGNPVAFYAKSGLMTGRIYRASVWVHNTNLSSAKLEASFTGSVNGSAYTMSYSASAATHLAASIDSWNLIQMDFEVPEGFSTTTGHLKVELKSTGSPVNVDDFILHPVESNFSAFVYDLRTDWLTATLDGNGISTRYVYDASGKVIEEWKEVPSLSTSKKTKTWTYHYGRGATN